MPRLIPKRILCRASNRRIPERLTLDTKLSVTAAKGGKPAAFKLVAYNGKPMTPSGFSEKVIVDLDGCRFQKSKSPVIFDHDTALRIGHTTKQFILAVGKKARSPSGEELNGPLIYAEGIPSSGMGISKGFVQDASNGFPFQVSIGADIEDAYFVDEDEKVVVNGKRWKGPLIVASRTSIAELSVTVLGADRETSATLAARRNSNKKEIYSMNFSQFLAGLGLKLSELNATQKSKLRAKFNAEMEAAKNAKAPKKSGTATATRRRVTASRGEPSTPPKSRSRAVPQRINASADDDKAVLQRRRQLMADEEARVDSIRLVFSKFRDDIASDAKIKFMGKEISLATFKKKAMENGDITVDQVELSLMKASLTAPTAEGANPAIHIAQQMRDMPSQVFACAMTRQSGVVKANAKQAWSGEEYGYEKWYSDEVLEASDSPKLKNLSLHQLMDLVNIQANGYSYHGNRKSDEFIRATRVSMKKLEASGPTTMSLTTIFEDSGHKMMWAAANGVETTWQEIAAVIPVSDFKTHNIYRLGGSGAYKLVGVDGELEHGGFSEEKFTHAADTYGKMVGLDRKHLINDDMGAFSRIMVDLGAESAKSMEELVYLMLLGNLATLFPTDGSKKNYISGANSNLSVEGMAQMEALWETQVDADNSPILIPAAKILVGTNNRTMARDLYNKTKIELPPQFVGTQRQFVDNPYSGRYPFVVSPFVNNTAIKQRVSKINKGAAIAGQTQTGWFTFADPNSPRGAAILVSLLNGNRLPVLESADMAFDRLGLQWRAYHDFGVDDGDPTMAAFSKGAA